MSAPRRMRRGSRRGWRRLLPCCGGSPAGDEDGWIKSPENPKYDKIAPGFDKLYNPIDEETPKMKKKPGLVRRLLIFLHLLAAEDTASPTQKDIQPMKQRGLISTTTRITSVQLVIFHLLLPRCLLEDLLYTTFIRSYDPHATGPSWAVAAYMESVCYRHKKEYLKLRPFKRVRKKNSKIHLCRKIGSGGFGQVFRATKIDKKGLFACKRIKISGTYKIYIKREIEIMRFVKHRNIIRLIDVQRTKTHVFITMPLCDGTLQDLLDADGALTQYKTETYFTDLINAVHYLHVNKVAHRDIKPANILLKDGMVKITDFGLAKMCVDDEQEQLCDDSFCGSESYSAPEIIMEVPYNPFPCDIWSLGVTMYQMVTGNVPFKTNNLQELNESLMQKLDILGNITDDRIRELLTSMLNMEPPERPTTQQILDFNWQKKEELFWLDNLE